MRILLIGSGGREHAMAWKLAQSKLVEKIYAAPGNGGTAGVEKCENVPLPGDPAGDEGRRALVDFARNRSVDLAVVGPEAPLAAGLADELRAAGFAVAGPGKREARLESSKVFSKDFMRKHQVRSARSEHFNDSSGALAFAGNHFQGQSRGIPAAPLMIKADGLAAGKGVAAALSYAQAEETITAFMERKSLGDAGAAVVLEEFIPGKEVSVLAAVNVIPGGPGIILPFISARDHKRRYDGGQGPNTGGMGAIAPAPDFGPEQQKDFDEHILKPTLRGMIAEAMDYRGFIFFGLMVKDKSSYLLEYNVRLGDPETQAALPLMDSDFAALCLAIGRGNLADFYLAWKPGAVCAPVAVAEGYPGPCRKGDPITVDAEALEKAGGRIFIAGAEGSGNSGLRVSGGRVLAVSAYGANGTEARERAYQAIRAVSFAGMDYRGDIGNEVPAPPPGDTSHG